MIQRVNFVFERVNNIKNATNRSENQLQNKVHLINYFTESL
jgi:hypothetical protein